jgi:hypothetical protein
MKKTLLLLSLISFSSIITAQVKVNQNAANSAINTSSAFMDASSSPLWNGTTNQGKGMLYPRVDLVNYIAMSHAGPFNASNNPNYFDGLLVFNTATGIAGIGADSVFPGYYYYRNTTTSANGGHWVSLKGIKGDDGTIGPIGPQGVQGVAGNDGAAGATGPQGTPGLTGITGPIGANGATGITGPSGVSGSSSNRMRIGFSSSTTWICPAGVIQITVELWSGAGGAGGNSYGAIDLNGDIGCRTSSDWYAQGKGGNGGNGGYNKVSFTTVPGNSYSIVIGLGGNAGNGGTSVSYNGQNGADGTYSSFNASLIVNGGQGGGAGTAGYRICSNGANGINGIILNYEYLTAASTRSYIPTGHITVPDSNSNGGGSPLNGFVSWGSYGIKTLNGLMGANGEAGFCIISY